MQSPEGWGGVFCSIGHSPQELRTKRFWEKKESISSGREALPQSSNPGQREGKKGLGTDSGNSAARTIGLY